MEIIGAILAYFFINSRTSQSMENEHNYEEMKHDRWEALEEHKMDIEEQQIMKQLKERLK